MLHAPHIIDMSCMQKKEKEEEKGEENEEEEEKKEGRKYINDEYTNTDSAHSWFAYISHT